MPCPEFFPQTPGRFIDQGGGRFLNFRHISGKRLLQFGDFGGLSESRILIHSSRNSLPFPCPFSTPETVLSASPEMERGSIPPPPLWFRDGIPTAAEGYDTGGGYRTSSFLVLIPNRSTATNMSLSRLPSASSDHAMKSALNCLLFTICRHIGLCMHMVQESLADPLAAWVRFLP
jgi:hypothetical protein